jgi:F0F1-type ATP synthase assembly protein I
MTDEPRPHGRGGDDSAPSAATYAGLGFQFAAAIVVFLFAGQWLDRRLETTPVFTIVGVFVGAGGAFYAIYRKLMAPYKRKDSSQR